jgi:glycosyltransferase involved in cell wall biosynthesis
MKIMLVTETLQPGGAEMFAVRLANYLSEQHAVVLAVLHGELIHKGVMDQVKAAVRVESLSLRAKSALWKGDGLLRRMRIDRSIIGWLQRRWLRRLVDQFRPAIVHSHLVPADILVASVRRGDDRRFAHVVTVHGDYAAYLSGATKPLFLNARRKMSDVLGGADRIVSIAADQKRHLLVAFPQLELAVIANGFAPPSVDRHPSRRELGLPEEGLLVGMVSRGVEKKGWASAIEAFQRAALDDACLVLVGSGPYLDALRRDALPPNVMLTGFSDRPTDFIRHFDLCLLPSEFPHETLPTAVIEYLYCGKPVIASDVGAIGSMIENPKGQRAGILVELDGKVDIDQLADAIRTLGTEPDERARLAAIAPEAFAKFSMRDCSDRYESLYRSLPN